MKDIIERLREDPLRNFDEGCQEIERLRHDYAELATRSVVAAKNAVVPYQMEIERLRDLLGDILQRAMLPEDTEQRVREALGESND